MAEAGACKCFISTPIKLSGKFSHKPWRGAYFAFNLELKKEVAGLFKMHYLQLI